MISCMRVCVVALTAGFAAMLVPVDRCRGELTESPYWDAPTLDTWFYENSLSTPGTRVLAPSFASLEYDSQSSSFTEGGGGAGGAPNRAASMLVAFDTSDQIPAGLSPSSYNIATVTVTSTLYYLGDPLTYGAAPVTPQQLLDAAATGGIDPALPMELFAVGFTQGYEGFALGPNQQGQLFDQGTAPYTGLGYTAFPASFNASGELQDASNNVSGGFSATEATGHTAPFVAAPLAIGVLDGFAQNDPITDHETFTFELDLTLPGVRDYIQQSLADGGLGFFVSSLHPAENPFESSQGSDPYPQWFTENSVDEGPPAKAASLRIVLADAFPAGDYNRDTVVDEADYTTWLAAYGSSVVTPGDGADGNADGVVDAIDFAFWREHVSLPSAPAPHFHTTPEPAAALLALVSTLTMIRTRSRQGATP